MGVFAWRCPLRFCLRLRQSQSPLGPRLRLCCSWQKTFLPLLKLTAKIKCVRVGGLVHGVGCMARCRCVSGIGSLPKCGPDRPLSSTLCAQARGDFLLACVKESFGVAKTKWQFSVIYFRQVFIIIISLFFFRFGTLI